MHTCSTSNLFLRKKCKLVEHLHLDAVRPICRSILDGVECCKWLQWTSLDSWLLYGGLFLKFREQGPTPVPVHICNLADVSRAWCLRHQPNTANVSFVYVDRWHYVANSVRWLCSFWIRHLGNIRSVLMISPFNTLNPIIAVFYLRRNCSVL